MRMGLSHGRRNIDQPRPLEMNRFFAFRRCVQFQGLGIAQVERLRCVLQDCADVAGIQRRIRLQQQRRGAGRVRRGHRRAGIDCVSPFALLFDRDSGVDIASRGEDVRLDRQIRRQTERREIGKRASVGIRAHNLLARPFDRSRTRRRSRLELRALGLSDADRGNPDGGFAPGVCHKGSLFIVVDDHRCRAVILGSQSLFVKLGASAGDENGFALERRAGKVDGACLLPVRVNCELQFSGGGRFRASL